MSANLLSQTGTVFKEGEKSPYSLFPGEKPRTTYFLGGIGGQSTDFEQTYYPIAGVKYELRHSFWYKKENFDIKRLGFSIHADLFLREGNAFMLTFPILYTYGESFTVFVGAGFMNREQKRIYGDLVDYTRLSILAVRFGFAYDFRFGNFIIRPMFNEDFFGNSSSYQFSLFFGISIL